MLQRDSTETIHLEEQTSSTATASPIEEETVPKTT